MRYLFSATPAHGPVLAMIPLVGAALDAGHDVAFLTAAHLGAVISDELQAFVPILGPVQSLPELISASLFRNGFYALTDEHPTSLAALLGGIRVDMALETAIAASRAWNPDVIVTDSFDFLGPLVASALHLPHITFTVAPHRPREIAEVFDEVADARFSRERLDKTPPLAEIDPNPVALQPFDWSPSPERLSLAGPDVERAAPRNPSLRMDGSDYRWSVLVTLGTVLPDSAALAEVIHVLDPLPVNTTVTWAGPTWASLPQEHAHRVHVPFTPLRDLLPEADVVISVGGAGTVLAALSHGVPLVLLPRTADQRATTQRVTATGAAVTADSPGDIGECLRLVMNDPGYTRAARTLQADMANALSPADVIRMVTDKVIARASTLA